MHKIIQIKGNPYCTSSGPPGSNGYHHGSGGITSNKRLAQSSSTFRNGGYRENGALGANSGLLPDNDSDTESEQDISQARPLNRLRNVKRKATDWKKMLANVLSLAIPIVFPAVHMYIFTNLWGHMKSPVDKKQCSCSCWDTIFKGRHISEFRMYFFQN